MIYRILLTETAAARISTLHPDLKKRTKKALKEIAVNPYLGKELQQELAGYLTYRFKRYRVIYTVDEELKTVIVHLVWPRKNVYELLSELVEK